ncbi:MAG: hypothetical protein B7X59_04145 [Polaromonas sp. 39-63-203]|jgi:type I restriction enzyme S subunit|uniref:restriction endonuclease subunit S n=1 Tax=Polaromonas sp. TaxID=1869339 RepID=UPI000BDC4501|nr:restriction endonuclease subunit S [Polaromonas sp.]OYY53079.1 MAG: hypothetical protein B7Y54_04425 [Polaromonas sp. 35-63-240]OYY99340.1 MAG: hypothetical protein B7Y42_06175 [Polaromonas sp. 28-63-22]OYZ84144.1 MAG: hypothetical protein B7Y03_05375 [Polaromonas sp. 24-62-144]OZA99285.1 MAG: hypothetical protein B7X59_04145 [Polaromonas sp. 39-63-203]HQS32551.1 restriction endonuclease subunit S [Polaromonas sp.]
MSFTETCIGDLLTFQRGFDITKAEQTEGTIPIVSSSGTSSYHNHWKVAGPGIVIGRKGTLGTTHFLASNFWPHDTTLWVKDFKGNDPKFLYYFLQTLHLENFDTGSSNPTLNRNHIHKIRVRFPALLETQQKIAAVLSAYDDLIANNQRRITLLERMAEDIYREWFVRLRFPGHLRVNFEKGVPQGWRAVCFSQICTFEKGKNPATLSYSPADGTLPYLNVETLEKEGISYAPRAKNAIVCSDDDVLMLMDGARSGFVFRGQAGIVSSTFALVRTESKFKNIVFEYLKAGKDAVVFNNTGSAIPHANKEFINRMTMFLPTDGVLVDRFNDEYQHIFRQTQNLAQQNAALTQTRDALLPRLISGKLAVDELGIHFPPGMPVLE